MTQNAHLAEPGSPGSPEAHAPAPNDPGTPGSPEAHAPASSDTDAPAPTEVTMEADRIEAELAAVDLALARLESREYGTCAVCQTPIDDALLSADPTLAVCPAHVALDATSY